MGRKRTPGLYKRKEVWHIDKQISGRRICQSCETDKLEEAEQCLARLVDESRKAKIYGERPTRSFETAAARYLIEFQHKKSIGTDIGRLKQLMPWVGGIALDKLHIGSLQGWVSYKREQGVTAGTINHGLKVVRRILNLAAGEWMDEFGLTWIHAAPKIRLLPDNNKRQPYPLNWVEQDRLFSHLPEHILRMALFKVNTGCRDYEVCNLRWEWEVKVPQLKTSVFMVPADLVKNGDERLVVLNTVASNVINKCRGNHDEFVFVFRGNPINKMLNSAWKTARLKAGLPQVRVHDLKHTFGRRLRAAGVSFEDRQDLLGHRSGRMTTHYSGAELSNLIQSSNEVCDRGKGRPELVVLRRLNIA